MRNAEWLHIKRKATYDVKQYTSDKFAALQRCQGITKITSKVKTAEVFPIDRFSLIWKEQQHLWVLWPCETQPPGAFLMYVKYPTLKLKFYRKKKGLNQNCRHFSKTEFILLHITSYVYGIDTYMYLPVIASYRTLDMDASPSLGGPLQNSPGFIFSFRSCLSYFHNLFAIWRKNQLNWAPPFQPHHRAWCSSSICSVGKGGTYELTLASIDS